MMKMRREWAMPNAATFTISPIRDILKQYMGGGVWVDPFAGSNSPATITNDLNPDTSAQYHMQAALFAETKVAPGIDGVLFDPPYSPRQIAEVYKSVGLSVGMEDTQSGRLYKQVKDILAQKLALGGTAICFGWNSQGFGKNRGCKLIEVILVAHGGAHNDTIITIEKKISHRADLFD